MFICLRASRDTLTLYVISNVPYVVPIMKLTPLKRPMFRISAAFFLLGLINNVLYVISLSAALDVVGPAVPKAVVLIANIIPAFIVKLVAPYFIHLVPYAVRVWFFVAISASGMFMVAVTPENHDAATISFKMLAIALASIGSGGGELSFVGLTYYYGHWSLAAWSSGTGAAGLVGAGAYVLATTVMGFSSSASLLVFSFLPVFMLVSYFIILPDPVNLEDDDKTNNSEPNDEEEESEREGLLSPNPLTAPSAGLRPASTNTFADNIRRAKSLVIPYMMPMFLVYVAEYTINQGVAPTLLFPVEETPFKAYRDFYPTYSALYQTGVFISRTSVAVLRVHDLYTPSFLQMANLAVLVVQALSTFLPSVWFIFPVVFWEGLLGGLVYANVLAEITDKIPKADREFSLSACTVADSAGISAAAIISLGLEKALCAWQVSHGRDFCQRS